MPTYEYECQNCEHRFDEFQSITAKPLKKCPECGRMKLQRLIGGGSGLIFKGSGFYITDYRSDSYKAGAKADSGSGSGASDGSKSELKSSDKKSNKSKKGSGKAAAG